MRGMRVCEGQERRRREGIEKVSVEREEGFRCGVLLLCAVLSPRRV